MKIQLTESFQRDVASLGGGEQSLLFSAILKLPEAIKNPHLYTGLGLRKIHPKGFFEARIGLGQRMVFAFEPSSLILHRTGTHDEIRHFLKSL